MARVSRDDTDDVADRRVDETTIGDYWVSTVRLRHILDDNEFFETMVFAKKPKLESDLWMERCRTLEEAQAMHQRGIAWVKGLNGTNFQE